MNDERFEDAEHFFVNLSGVTGATIVDGQGVGTILDNDPRAPGDSNQDGIFNSADLVLVFQGGEYEDEIAGNSTFEKGDWNGDGEFNSRDLVFAFQQGNYVSAAVPESLFSQPHRERRRGDEIIRGDYGPLDSLFAELA